MVSTRNSIRGELVQQYATISKSIASTLLDSNDANSFAICGEEPGSDGQYNNSKGGTQMPFSTTIWLYSGEKTESLARARLLMFFGLSSWAIERSRIGGIDCSMSAGWSMVPRRHAPASARKATLANRLDRTQPGSFHRCALEVCALERRSL